MPIVTFRHQFFFMLKLETTKVDTFPSITKLRVRTQAKDKRKDAHWLALGGI